MRELILYGVVGEEITDVGVAADLQAIANEREIMVRLSSPGGSAYQGIAILNNLRRFPGTVNITVDAWACSAGSIIAMGASPGRLSMARNAALMIHEAEHGAWENASQKEKTAQQLRKLDNAIADAYVSRAGKTRAYWLERMALESWYSADEALAAGLVDRVVSESQLVQMDMAAALRFSKHPDRAAAFAQRVAARNSTSPSDLGVAAFLRRIAARVAEVDAQEHGRQPRAPAKHVPALTKIMLDSYARRAREVSK
jgi:ATP-dependent protease ClpP protease subunit